MEMGKKRILIVEDENIIAEDIKKTVTKNQYDVIDVVASGAKALEVTAAQKPDLILMDIMLEGETSGIDVAAKIKSANIPVIFLTAYADAERIEKAKLTEPFGYLLKPFRERELIVAIKMALYKNKMENKLKCSLQNYQRIFENIQDVYFEIGTNGDILQISPSLEEQTSYRTHDVLKKNVYDYAFDSDEIDACISKLTKDRYVSNYLLRFKDLDGTPITVLCSAKFIVDKKISKSKIVGSLKNISHDLHIQKEFQATKIRYNKLFETASDAIFLYGENGFINCNEAALEMFSVKKKDYFFNLHPEDFSPANQPEGRPSLDFINETTPAVLNGNSKTFEWIFQKPNGETFRAKVWLSAIEVDGKKIIQSTLRDLSKTDKLKQQLVDQQLKIEKTVNEKLNVYAKNIEDLQKKLIDKESIINRLKKNDAFNNALFDNIPIETIVVNNQGEIISFNLAVQNNRSHPPVIGDKMYIDYAARHQEDMFGHLIDCIRTGKQKNFPALPYNNKVLNITIAPYQHGAIINSQDITSRKKTENRMKKLNSIFENMGSDSQSNINYIVKEICLVLDATCSFLFISENNNNQIFSSYQLPPNFELGGAEFICYSVHEQKQLLVIEDIENSPLTEHKPCLAKKFGLRSLMRFPVIHNNHTSAFIFVLDRKPRSFNQEEKYAFYNLAKVLSIELERMYSADSIKKIFMTQNMLLNTARYINSSLNFTEVTKRITKEAMEILNAYGSAVYLLDKDGITLNPVVVIDPDFKDEIASTSIKIDNSYTGKAIKNKEVMIFNDTINDENGYQIPGTTELTNEKILAAPLISENKVLGAICLNKIGADFSSEDMEIMEILANHATTALKNAETFEQLQIAMQERIRAEKQRDESLKQLHSLQSNVPVGIFRSTPTGKLLSINKTFVAMFGYNSEEEILPINTTKLYCNTQDQEKIITTLQQKGMIDDYELCLKRKNGTTFWALMSIKAVKDNSGTWIYQDGIINDISKRKQTEDQLYQSQMRLATIFNNVPNIVLFETGGEKEFVSENVLQLLGYKAQKFISDPDFFFSLIHTEDINFVQKKYNEWKKDGRKEVLNLWCRVRKADGSYIWIEDRRVGISDKQDRTFESGVRIDTTNLKNAEEELKQSYEKLQNLLAATVNGLVSAVEMRDPYTAGHQRRVAQLAVEIAKKMKLSKHEIEGLNLAALVHDIGKINVPAEILSKPGKLTRAEFNLIKTHPQTGYDILKSIEFPWPVADIVLQHQERYDGSSYPQGLKGEEIHLHARILCVADVMEAMSSHRPYRPSLGTETAIDELKKNSGILYDPQVVEACLEIFEKDGFEFVNEV